jgi:hypothetical protein
VSTELLPFDDELIAYLAANGHNNYLGVLVVYAVVHP